MKRVGIEKAEQRLSQARKHGIRLSELAQGLDVPAFEYEWFQFLSALDSVFEVLCTTARKDPTSKQWWFGGPEKEVTKQNPILRFLHHARGADFHGLECGTAPDVTGADYQGYVQDPPFSMTFVGDDGEEFTMKGGAIHLLGNFESFTFRYRLVPVTNQRSVVFDPPTRHDGTPLSPIEAVRSSLEYYAQLVSRAQQRMTL